jgi:inosose dehydratase
MAVRLSCHAITWGPDTLGAMKDISDFEFEGIECFTQVSDQYRDNPDLFRRVLDDHGLKLVALYGGGKMLRDTRDADIEYNERVAQFVAAVGGDRMMLGGGDRRRDADGRDHFTEDDLRDMCETMNRIGEVARSFGVRACYHPHIDTIGEEPENVDRIFAMTDPELVAAGPDPAHLFLGGYDPIAFFTRYAHRIAYMHLKDVPACYTPDNWKPAWKQLCGQGDAASTERIPLFCELGEGQLDLHGIIRVMRENGYDGWITTEIDVTAQPSPRDSLRINRAFWDKIS